MAASVAALLSACAPAPDEAADPGPDQGESLPEQAVLARPVIGPCAPWPRPEPAAGEIHLWEDNLPSGRCWSVKIPRNTEAEVDFVGTVGIPNDAITAVSMGPGTFLAMFEHAGFGGAMETVDNWNTYGTRLFDDLGSGDGVNRFNDRTSSFRMAAYPHPRPLRGARGDTFTDPRDTAPFTRVFQPGPRFPSATRPPAAIIAICMDPHEGLGRTLPTAANLAQQLDEVRGWFRTVSLQRFNPPAVQLVGCGQNNTAVMEAPMAHQGTYFEDLARTDGIPHMTQVFRADALLGAQAAGVNFAQFDRNGDRALTGDELGVIIIRPFTHDDGSERPTAVTLGRITSVKAVDLVLSGTEPNPPARLGLITHELMHHFTGAADMYDAPIFSAGYHSIMQNHAGLNWLDPLHALKLGWLNPRAFLLGTGTLELRTQDGAGDVAILYDPAVGTREYFIVARLSRGGVSLWRIVEDRSRVEASPWAGAYRAADFLTAETWGRWAIHKVNGSPLANGQNIRLEFTTGQTGYQLRVEANPAEGSQDPVRIAVSR